MAAVNSVGNSLTGLTGTGLFVGATSPTITTPKIAQINDTNGNAILTVNPIAASVNNVVLQNSSTGTGVGFYATGTDPNVAFFIQSQGTGSVQLYGASGSTQPLTILNGTSYQHATTFTMANTAQSRTITVPDADGTLVFSATGQVVASVSSANITGSSTTSTTFVDVTSASLAITPTSASNKVLVIVTWQPNITVVVATNTIISTQVLRDSTVIPTGVAQAFGASSGAGGLGWLGQGSFCFLDSPATTSSTTYKLQHKSSVGTATASSSNITITLMEIKG